MGLDASLIAVFIIFAIVFIVSGIFFLLTQQNTLKAIQPQNRTMSPGEVWLQLIPLFNLVWQFVVVSRIADSIDRELKSEMRFSFEGSQGDYSSLSGEKPTYNIGLACCILRLCGLIPVVGFLASLAGLVCWIMYWSKLAEYKRKIESKTYLVSPPSMP